MTVFDIILKFKLKKFTTDEAIELISKDYRGMKGFLRVLLRSVESEQATVNQAVNYLKYEHKVRRSVSILPNIDESD